jgi:hypothetical protein
MYGVLAGDLTGFPSEYRHVDLKESGAALFKVPEKEPDASMAGNVFSDRTVLTAAAEEGLMRFEKRMAEIFTGCFSDSLSATVISSPTERDSILASFSVMTAVPGSRT